MNLSGLGSLGLGTALNTGLNIGLNTGNTFADYQTKRATEEAAQVATNEANMTNFIKNHRDRLAISASIPNMMQDFATKAADSVKAQQYQQAQVQAQAQPRQYAPQQGQANYGAVVPTQTQANPQVAQINPNPQGQQTLGGLVAQPIQAQQMYVPPTQTAMPSDQALQAYYASQGYYVPQGNVIGGRYG